MMAAQNGHGVIVELLLSKGAGVNRVASDGITLLLTAVQRGFLGIVELLLSMGANINFANSRWCHAIEYRNSTGQPFDFGVARV